MTEATSSVCVTFALPAPLEGPDMKTAARTTGLTQRHAQLPSHGDARFATNGRAGVGGAGRPPSRESARRDGADGAG